MAISFLNNIWSANTENSNNNKRKSIQKNADVPNYNIFETQTTSNEIYGPVRPTLINQPNEVLNKAIQGGLLADKSQIEDYENAINNGGEWSETEDNTDKMQAEYTQSRKDLTNSDIEKLQSEKEQVQTNKLEPAKTDLSEAQSALSAIQSGENADISNLKTAMEAAEKEYNAKLSEEDDSLANDIKSAQQEIESKESEIAEADVAITEKESELAEAETKLSSATANKEAAYNTLQSYKSLNTDDLDDDKKNSLNSKISAAEAEYEKAQEAEKEAKMDKIYADTALSRAKEKKGRLEEQLTQMKERKEELDAKAQELANNNTELQAALEKYENAKDAYESKKEELISHEQDNISKAQAAVTDAQESITKIDAQINEAKDKESRKEFQTDQEILVEYASQFEGVEGGSAQADAFLDGMDSGSIAWCAGFVNYMVKNSGMNVPSWYQDVSGINGPYSCYSWRTAAENKGATKSINDAQPGDLVLFDWKDKYGVRNGQADHIGIVVGIENNQLKTIEGNTDNKVNYCYYDLDSKDILEILDTTK